MNDPFNELDHEIKAKHQKKILGDQFSTNQQLIRDGYLQLVKGVLQEFAEKICALNDWLPELIDIHFVGDDPNSEAISCYHASNKHLQERFPVGYQYEEYFVMLEIDSYGAYTGYCQVGRCKLTRHGFFAVSWTGNVFDEEKVHVDAISLKHALLRQLRLAT
jgi:hypothetical protein